jgi:hypothetical protein
MFARTYELKARISELSLAGLRPFAPIDSRAGPGFRGPHAARVWWPAARRPPLEIEDAP